MIKVESDMLVLDSSFSKEDALAINQFVEITKIVLCLDTTLVSLFNHYHSVLE